MGVEPYPINPFRWHAILETRGFFQTAEVNTHTGAIDSDPQTDVLYKPDETPAIEAAKRTSLGRVYLDWGTWAVVRDVGQQPVPGVDPPQLPPGRSGPRGNSPTCASPMRSSSAGRQRPPSRTERLGLHRRRPRRSGGRHGRSREQK